jgi:hypothetical protein
MKTNDPRTAFLLGAVVALAAVFALRENPGTARADVFAGTGTTSPGLIIASTTGAQNIDSALIVADPQRRTVAIYSIARNRFALRSARAFANDLDIFDERPTGNRTLSVADARQRAMEDARIPDMQNRRRHGGLALLTSPGRSDRSTELYFYIVDIGSQNLAAYTLDSRNRIVLRGARFFGYDMRLQDEANTRSEGITVEEARRAANEGPIRPPVPDDDTE